MQAARRIRVLNRNTRKHPLSRFATDAKSLTTHTGNGRQNRTKRDAESGNSQRRHYITYNTSQPQATPKAS